MFGEACSSICFAVMTLTDCGVSISGVSVRVAVEDRRTTVPPDALTVTASARPASCRATSSVAVWPAFTETVRAAGWNPSSETRI